MDCVRPANGRRRRLAEPQVADLAALDQPLHGADGVLDGHRGIDAVLVVEVDDVHAHALEARVARLGDVLGSAVDRGAPVGRPHLAELRGDHDSIPPPTNRAAEKLLVVAEAVHVRGIEEIDAQVQGAVHDLDGLRVVALAVRARHLHAAEPDGRYRERTVAERPVFHDVSFVCGRVGKFPRDSTTPRARPWLAGLATIAAMFNTWQSLAARSADLQTLTADPSAFPFKTELSLAPLSDFWAKKFDDDSSAKGAFIRTVREQVKQVPELLGRITDLGVINRHRHLMDVLMSGIFPPAFFDQEFSAVLIPFVLKSFHATPPFDRLLRTEDGMLRGRVNLDASMVTAMRLFYAY